MSFLCDCTALLAQKSLHLSHTFASSSWVLKGVLLFVLFVCLVVPKCGIHHIIVLFKFISLGSAHCSCAMAGNELQFFWPHGSYRLNGSKTALFGRLLTIILGGIISKVGLPGISLISCFGSFLLQVIIC